MGLSPRIVTETRNITWDGVQQRLPKGQVLDVPPGSALEREIGRDFLVPLPGSAPVAAAVPAPAEKPAPREEAAPAKLSATAKDAGGKDGEL
jgi:hypothetical protein